MGLICLLMAVMTTHGLGGYLWHKHEMGHDMIDAADTSGDTAWHFFQPFAGKDCPILVL
jgi:hypothetical protein